MYCILLFSGYLNSSLVASGLPSLNKISNSNSNVLDHNTRPMYQPDTDYKGNMLQYITECTLQLTSSLSLVHYNRFGVTCPHVEEDGH